MDDDTQRSSIGGSLSFPCFNSLSFFKSSTLKSRILRIQLLLDCSHLTEVPRVPQVTQTRRQNKTDVHTSLPEAPETTATPGPLIPASHPVLPHRSPKAYPNAHTNQHPSAKQNTTNAQNYHRETTWNRARADTPSWRKVPGCRSLRACLPCAQALVFVHVRVEGLVAIRHLCSSDSGSCGHQRTPWAVLS